ncbi:HGGxSTG domain-containing protein [Roseomonas chloroacetimidivorans]|uniref:HGGxSTG domain-containing protein n=1 Tax=Roseomonas chloroacetimidivorans TaxID=1766656 RepID=UPI003C75C484
MTLDAAREAKRCFAKTRSGGRCQSPAMPNGRCRMHGGLSTGPRTAEGLERSRRARHIHGCYGADAKLFRRLIRDLKKNQKQIIEKY